MLSAVKLYQSSSISGPVATAKPRSAKISASSSITWLTGCTVPARRFGGRQREVERLGSKARFEFGGFEHLLARGQRIGHVLPQRLDRRRLFLPLFRAHLAERLEQARDAALLAEKLDPQRFERGQVFGGGDAALGIALESVEFGHGLRINLGLRISFADVARLLAALPRAPKP